MKHLILDKSPFVFFSIGSFVGSFPLLSFMGFSHFHLCWPLLLGPTFWLAPFAKSHQQCWGLSSSMHSTNFIKSWHVSSVFPLWNTKQQAQGFKPYKKVNFLASYSLIVTIISMALNSCTYLTKAPCYNSKSFILAF